MVPTATAGRVTPPAADGAGDWVTMTEPGPTATSFWDEFRDAVTPRAVLLVVGVAVIQVAFITSYVGAFHHPEPHGLPVAVVAPAADAPQLVKALNGIPGHPVQVTAVSSVAAGTRQLLRRDVFGVLVVDPTATSEQLLEASASGVSASVAATDVLDAVAARYHRTVVVHDIRPPAPGDRNGLTSFYLVIGWIVGGYLVASILGISTGSRPANARRATLRLGAIAVYALVTGMAGAIVVGPVLHALPGPTVQLGLLGALVIFCAGAFAMALLVVAGTIGIGLAIIVFVVLGNPSAGGPYAWQLLPPFWRDIGPWLPSGAGTAAARGIAYFGSTAITANLLVVAAYGVVGVIVVYVVLLDVGHQLVDLPQAAGRATGRDDTGDGGVGGDPTAGG
jgi:hypothetical protein